MAVGLVALIVVPPVPKDVLTDANVMAPRFDDVLIALLQAPP